MRCSIATVLATFLAGQAAAASIKHGHQHLHTKKEAQPSAAEVYVKRNFYINKEISTNTRSSGITARQSELITSTDIEKLTSLGALAGLNAVAAGASAWIGTDGTYSSSFTNNAGDAVILVIWGPDGSWVNVGAPLITYSLAPLATVTISFAEGLSGAWSAVYPDTEMVDGQVSNTWGEFTFTPSGVVDVSREVNMSGHGMVINGPQCTADMDTCVFVCDSGNVCMTDYSLLMCDNGSQEGAQYGLFDGFPSGGCGWNGLTSVTLDTQFY